MKTIIEKINTQAEELREIFQPPLPLLPPLPTPEELKRRNAAKGQFVSAPIFETWHGDNGFFQNAQKYQIGQTMLVNDQRVTYAGIATNDQPTYYVNGLRGWQLAFVAYRRRKQGRDKNESRAKLRKIRAQIKRETAQTIAAL